jgi:hypothetical protein
MIALFGELILEEAMDLSQDTLLLDLDDVTVTGWFAPYLLDVWLAVSISHWMAI